MPTKKFLKMELNNHTKTWLTQGILKSIKIKNRIYKQFCTCSYPDKKLELHLKFKKYRNSVVVLTGTCQENYYKDYFETNKKDATKIGAA